MRALFISSFLQGAAITRKPSWMTDNLVFWSGVLLGVAGIATGLVTYWLARKPKYIDYEVKASQRILATKESDRLDSN